MDKIDLIIKALQGLQSGDSTGPMYDGWNRGQKEIIGGKASDGNAYNEPFDRDAGKAESELATSLGDLYKIINDLVSVTADDGSTIKQNVDGGKTPYDVGGDNRAYALERELNNIKSSLSVVARALAEEKAKEDEDKKKKDDEEKKEKEAMAKKEADEKQTEALAALLDSKLAPLLERIEKVEANATAPVTSVGTPGLGAGRSIESGSPFAQATNVSASNKDGFIAPPNGGVSMSLAERADEFLKGALSLVEEAQSRGDIPEVERIKREALSIKGQYSAIASGRQEFFPPDISHPKLAALAKEHGLPSKDDIMNAFQEGKNKIKSQMY